MQRYAVRSLLGRGCNLFSCCSTAHQRSKSTEPGARVRPGQVQKGELANKRHLEGRSCVDAFPLQARLEESIGKATYLHPSPYHFTLVNTDTARIAPNNRSEAADRLTLEIRASRQVSRIPALLQMPWGISRPPL